MDSMGATLMTDMSLFYESDVTIPLVYGAPMTPRTTTVDAESSSQKEVDRRRGSRDVLTVTNRGLPRNADQWRSK
jgi:hypothetical protein